MQRRYDSNAERQRAYRSRRSDRNVTDDSDADVAMDALARMEARVERANEFLASLREVLADHEAKRPDDLAVQALIDEIRLLMP